MSATNQTTNYDLPLFIGTDKPSWLGDFNGAMNAIDSAIKGNADEIDSLKTRMTATETVANTASTTSSTALTNANNAQTSANAAQLTADSANTAATAAQSTANTALSNATTAQNTADTAQATATSAMTLGNANAGEIEKFNLSEVENYTASDMSVNYGTINNVSYLNVITNSNGTIGKIYGRLVSSNPNTSNEVEFTIPNTKVRPSEEIIITGTTLRTWFTSTGLNDIANSGSITISTNGTIKIKGLCATTIIRLDLNVMGCLLFFKDFGDTTPVE